MGQVWLGVNRFETEKGVWTVVRVEGDSYAVKDHVKACGAFRYGFPFDLFVAFKQKSGLNGGEFVQWLERNADRRDKRWSCYYAGAPEINRGKIDELARDLAQRCGWTVFPVRETQPLFLAPAGTEIHAEPAKPAEPEEPEEWTDPDTDPDLPF